MNHELLIGVMNYELLIELPIPDTDYITAMKSLGWCLRVHTHDGRQFAVGFRNELATALEIYG